MHIYFSWCIYPWHDDIIKWKHFPHSPVTSEFPSQRPVTQDFDVFFALHLNKRLSKQLSGWWFWTPSHSLWHHCNELLWYYAAILNDDPGIVCYWNLKQTYKFSAENACNTASKTVPSWDCIIMLTPNGMNAEVGRKFSHHTLENIATNY